MKEIPNNWSIEKWEENKELAQEILDSWEELCLVTKVKIEQVLGIREKPSEEQVKKFRSRLWTICN